MMDTNKYYGAPGLKEYFLSLGAECDWNCDSKECCYWIEDNEVCSNFAHKHKDIKHFNNLKYLIKHGNVIEMQDNKKYLVLSINDDIIFVGKDGYFNFNNYDNELNNKSGINLKIDDWHIVRIYEGLNNGKYGFGSGFQWYLDNHAPESKIIWERPAKVVELTMQEIADEFNITIEQLRIKDYV